MRRVISSLAVLIASGAGACGGPEEVGWTVAFATPELAARAAVVEARVLEGGCDDPSARVLHAVEIVEGAASAMSSPALPAGRYGLWARARDASCVWYARGCNAVELPAGDEGALRVELVADSEQVACPAAACTGGRCDEAALVEIEAGRAHTCTRTWAGTAWCWGRNTEGQVGDGSFVDSSTPVRVADLAAATDLAAGGNSVGWQSHTCAMRAPSSVVCWGYNQFGELGDGTTMMQPTPVPVAMLTTAVGISAGDLHTCAALASGDARCWGANDSGQLGDGTTEPRLTPARVLASGIVELAAGGSHTCARVQAGSVLCWGANDRGQLGDGTTTDRSNPAAQVQGIDGTVASVGAGVDHTCAVTSDGRAWCWGAGDRGQIGDGASVDRTSAVNVTGLTDVIEVSAGGGHSCARLRSGAIACWGQNNFGELGAGTTPSSPSPVAVHIIDDALDLDVGNSHACVVRASGSVWCWGRNQYGRLGDGTTVDRFEPVEVGGLAL